jgi:hypothetical protein
MLIPRFLHEVKLAINSPIIEKIYLSSIMKFNHWKKSLGGLYSPGINMYMDEKKGAVERCGNVVESKVKELSEMTWN